MNGVLPTDLGLWAAMEPNLGPIIMYGTDSNIRYAYNYIGRNPATVLLSDEDIVLDAWAEYFSNDEYTNPLHTAITNYKSDGDEYFVENFFVQPLQLRNVRHLIMTVTDATTDEIYYVDDTEYLPKAYFDSDYAAWSSYGSFYWDGYVENEESELYGTYVPNGTVCLVKFETQIDYEDAPLKIEKQFQLIVDTESVKVTGIDIVPEEVPAEQEGDPATTKPVMTISVADNGSGVAFADAYYFDEAMTAHDLDIIYADGDLKFDMADMPESNPFIVLETLDYATNYKSYTINVKTKELVDSDYEIGTVEFVASQILAGENLGTVQSIQAFITDVYDGVVYVAPIDPMDPEGPSGMMVQLSNPKMAKFINVGDAMVFGGTLDLVNGCPCLTDAEIGDLLWDSSISDVDLMYYYVIYYMMWDWPDTLEPIVTQPELYVGGTYYLEDLLIIDITENDDGTLTLTVTDGDITIDIVHTTVADDAKVGDMVYVGIFVPVFDQGELALRVVYDSPDYIVIVPADD